MVCSCNLANEQEDIAQADSQFHSSFFHHFQHLTEVAGFAQQLSLFIAGVKEEDYLNFTLNL